MSFLRRLLPARRPPGPPAYMDPSNYGSLKDYSYALMRNAVATETATALLVAAKKRYEGQTRLVPLDAAERVAEGRRERREAQEYAALAASQRLLREIGAADAEPEDFEPEPVARLSLAEMEADQMFAPDGQTRHTFDPRFEVQAG
jgi:hypothetical protein